AAVARRHVDVVGCDVARVAQDAHAVVDGIARGRSEEVLDREGDTAEGTVRQVRRRLRPRLVEQGVDDRVELGVELLDAGDRPLTNPARPTLPGRTRPALRVGIDPATP